MDGCFNMCIFTGISRCEQSMPLCRRSDDVDCSQRPPTDQARLCWRPTTSAHMQARFGEPLLRCNTLFGHCEDFHSVNRASRCKGSVCPERSQAVHTSSKRRPHGSKAPKSWHELHSTWMVALTCAYSRESAAVNSQCPCVAAAMMLTVHSARPPTRLAYGGVPQPRHGCRVTSLVHPSAQHSISMQT